MFDVSSGLWPGSWCTWLWSGAWPATLSWTRPSCSSPAASESSSTSCESRNNDNDPLTCKLLRMLQMIRARLGNLGFVSFALLNFPSDLHYFWRLYLSHFKSKVQSFCQICQQITGKVCVWYKDTDLCNLQGDPAPCSKPPVDIDFMLHFSIRTLYYNATFTPTSMGGLEQGAGSSRTERIKKIENLNFPPKCSIFHLQHGRRAGPPCISSPSLPQTVGCGYTDTLGDGQKCHYNAARL